MRWPRILGPVPSLKDVNLLGWLLLAAVAAPLFVTHSGQEKVRIADFVQIYTVGRMLNEYPAEDLYNYPLQQKLFGEIRPLKRGFYGPSPYPPFVAVFFRPFARMSYLSAYLLWMSISLALYLAGLFIITGRFFRGDPPRRSLIFCFALAFNPFIVGTLLNGQLSALGFFALALAIREDDSGRPVPSGLALSLCTYKPTLLVLILPMLFVTRRIKTLAGFGMGALALILFATAAEGDRVWSGYFDLLQHFNGMHSSLRLPVYIDFRSFAALLSPRHSWAVSAVLWGFAGWAALCLVWVWMRSVGGGKTVSSLVWATTITWTLVLNVYVPVYDSILIVISIVATAGLVKNFGRRWFGLLCLLIFGIVWINVEIAERTGFQVLTLLLAALGILQLQACRREMAMSLEGRSPELFDRQRQEVAAPSLRKGSTTIVTVEPVP